MSADDSRDALARRMHEISCVTKNHEPGEGNRHVARCSDAAAILADGSRFLPAQAAEQDAPEPLTVEALATALRATRDERYVLGHQRDRDVAEDEAAVILAALPSDWPDPLPQDREALANDLYIRVVNPDLTWWDDLTPEMQEGWLRAADWLLAAAPPAAPTSALRQRLGARIAAAIEAQPDPWATQYAEDMDSLLRSLESAAPTSEPCGEPVRLYEVAYGDQYDPCTKPKGHDGYHDPSAPTSEQDRPRIVCLCGSTRFYDAFQQANYDLTMAGKIVLSVGFYPHAKAKAGHGEGVGHDSTEKVALDALHLRKIDLADEVYVLNVDSYIGESTRHEIDYAVATGKPVRYLEPPLALDEPVTGEPERQGRPEFSPFLLDTMPDDPAR